MVGTRLPINDDYALFSTDPSVISPLMSRKDRFFSTCSALVPKFFVSPEAAARDYGVAVTDLGEPGRLVRMPSEFAVDAAATGSVSGGGAIGIMFPCR